MYEYKDFVTRKLRRTRGQFSGWTKPTGLLCAPYAVFKNPRGRVFVPVYLLTKETLSKLPLPPNK